MTDNGVELMDLAHCGDLDSVKRLIHQGVGVNTTNQSNQTALYLACESGETEVAQYLLDCGADVNLGAKPLIAAVRNGHDDCVELLLKHRANVYCTNIKGKSPMSIAQQKRRYSIILSLLQYGATPSVSLIDRPMSLKLVKYAKLQHSEAITKLIDDNIINLASDDVFMAAFGYAFNRGVIKLAERMILNDSCAKLEQLYPFAVYYSAKHNWPDVLLTLLEKQVNVNMLTEGQTPLYVGCKKGHESIVNLLLSNGADPNISSKVTSPEELQLPVQIAVHHANVTIFNMLVDKGAKLHNEMISTDPLLHIACSPFDEWKNDSGVQARSTENLLSVIRVLHHHGVAVNAVSTKGDSALYRACKSQQLAVVQTLLGAGADVNLTTRRLYPLIAACETGSAELINLLLNAEADVTCSSHNDETCLHVLVKAYAANAQHATDGVSSWDITTIIRSLLRYGVNVNACCSQQETALYRACKAGHEDVVRVLLEAGAETNGPSSRRPLYAACKHGHTQVVDLLLQHGADSNLPSACMTMGHLLGLVERSVNVEPVSLPICCAMKNGYTGIVKLLMQHGADVNMQESSGKSALIYVTERIVSQNRPIVDTVTEMTDFDILKSMLLAGGDVNLLSTSDGLNALHLASSRGRCDVMAELIENGADCNRPTGSGKSAVDLACEKDHDASVEMLLKNGANPNGKVVALTDHAGCSSSKSPEPALCSAAKSNNDYIVNMLVKHGADVNTSSRNGDTALHLTTSSTVMETLLRAGANVNAVNDRGETALSKVCSETQASLNIAEMLLKFGADANVHFPLHDACKNDSVDLVRLLLKYGAKANLLKQTASVLTVNDLWMSGLGLLGLPRISRPREPSPLCIACRNGNVPMVDCLLKRGASVGFTNFDGNTPLHFAIERLGNQAIVEEYDPIVTLLLQHESPVDVISDNGETPLYVACRKGLVGVARQLLDCKANVGLTTTTSNKHPLLAACEGKSRELTMMLLNRGANPNVPVSEATNNQTPLKVAASNGDTELVKELLSHGADVNQMQDYSDTALHVAVIPREHLNTENSVNIVKRLLKLGAKPNALNHQCETPLYLACKQPDAVNLDIIQALLEHGADPNICPHSSKSYASPSYYFYERDCVGLPPLPAAASCSNTGLMSLLIKFGARLDYTDSQGRTALHHAILLRDGSTFKVGVEYNRSDSSAAEMLLSAGADVNALDKTNVSPLYLACNTGRTELVKLLLSRNANPNKGVPEKCPMHAACFSQCYEAVKLLLKCDAHVSARDKNGKTALHYMLEGVKSCNNAGSENKSALVKLLLDQRSIDINAASADGETPLYVACSKGLLPVVKLMLEYGAEMDANTGEKLPLNIACRNEHLAVVQLLLSNGANPNPNVPYLWKYDYDAILPLAIAASDNNSELVELLLKHGAGIDATDAGGETALHFAVRNKVSTWSRYSGEVTSTSSKKSVIDILLENKADVNLVSSSTETPLYIAVSCGLVDDVKKMLEEYRGNPNKASPVNNPLLAACERSSVQLVHMLLKHGADPNLGWNSCDLKSTNKLALCVAVQEDNEEIVTSLLQAGPLEPWSIR